MDNDIYNLQIIKNECEKLFGNLDSLCLKNKSILITGANGLIGSFLADFLNYLNEEFDYNISLHLTSYSSREQCERISHLIGGKNINYFSWDMTTILASNLLQEKVDYTFFCSGYGQPAKFLKDPIKTIKINTTAVDQLLDHPSMAHSVFLYCSTSEIYGKNPVESPTTENSPGIYDYANNRSNYIVAKMAAEAICKEYCHHKGIDVKIARIALVYGPGVKYNDDRVMQEFIKKGFSGSIKMLDSGISIRSYLYIRDCCEMLLNIAMRGENRVYNVGGDSESISIYELAQKVARITNATVTPGNSDKSKISNSPVKVKLCIDRYRKEFNRSLKQPVKINYGLQKTVDWLKENNEEK